MLREEILRVMKEQDRPLSVRELEAYLILKGFNYQTYDVNECLHEMCEVIENEDYKYSLEHKLTTPDQFLITLVFLIFLGIVWTLGFYMGHMKV